MKQRNESKTDLQLNSIIKLKREGMRKSDANANKDFPLALRSYFFEVHLFL